MTLGPITVEHLPDGTWEASAQYANAWLYTRRSTYAGALHDLEAFGEDCLDGKDRARMLRTCRQLGLITSP